MYALNIHSSHYVTTGDWHSSILTELKYSETEDDSGLYFIERCSPYRDLILERVWVANHYRAVADMLHECVNTPNIRRLRGCVEDWLDGDAAGLLPYVKDLRGKGIEVMVSNLATVYERTMENAEARGKARGKAEVIREMHNSGMDVDMIVKMINISKETVMEILEKTMS